MGESSVDSVAGFVLTGGNSTRMRQDKALLPFAGATLVEHVARAVRAAAGSATLIGAPERYGCLGLPVVADLVEDCGPLGGLYTALQITKSDWNLVVGCDMPGVTGEFLASLLRTARLHSADCLVPESGSGIHPLCAVYHRRIFETVQVAISRKSLKLHDLLSSLQTVRIPLDDSSFVENINTPVEWDLVKSTR